MVSQSVTEDTDFFSSLSLILEQRKAELITVSNGGTLFNDWSRGDEADSREGNGSFGEEHGGKLNNTRPAGLGIDRGVGSKR